MCTTRGGGGSTKGHREVGEGGVVEGEGCGGMKG